MPDYKRKRIRSSRIGPAKYMKSVGKGRCSSIAGFYHAQAERVVKYIFQEYFLGIQKDEEKVKWRIILDKKIADDKEMMEIKDSFLEYWSPSFWYVVYGTEYEEGRRPLEV